MTFTSNALDEQLRVLDDRESVSIILCASGDATVAKLALHRVYAPIAVSTWRTGSPRPELPAERRVRGAGHDPHLLAGWGSDLAALFGVAQLIPDNGQSRSQTPAPTRHDLERTPSRRSASRPLIAEAAPRCLQVRC